MKSDVDDPLAALLAVAEQAIDPRENGLMDRTDYQETVFELVKAIRNLSEAYEEVVKERDELASRLSRRAILDNGQLAGAHSAIIAC